VLVEALEVVDPKAAVMLEVPTVKKLSKPELLTVVTLVALLAHVAMEEISAVLASAKVAVAVAC
jgi:hypothetical protein